MSGGFALSLLVSALVGLGVTPAAAATPDMTLSFGFEPRIGTYGALDSKLRDYRYEPVGAALLPAWGLRGRVFFSPRWFGSLSMSYVLRSVGEGATNTTLTLIDTMAGVGYRWSSGVFVSFDAGFTALTQTVASTFDGGAMLYLGPAVHPRVGWSHLFSKPLGWFVAVSLGANVHTPLGAAHSNPLWEDSFQRPAIPSFTIGLESGLGSARSSSSGGLGRSGR